MPRTFALFVGNVRTVTADQLDFRDLHGKERRAMPLFDVFWSMLWFFLFIAWIRPGAGDCCRLGCTADSWRSARLDRSGDRRRRRILGDFAPKRHPQPRGDGDCARLPQPGDADHYGHDGAADGLRGGALGQCRPYHGASGTLFERHRMSSELQRSRCSSMASPRHRNTVRSGRTSRRCGRVRYEPMTARSARKGWPGSDRLSSGGFRADEPTGERFLQ